MPVSFFSQAIDLYKYKAQCILCVQPFKNTWVTIACSDLIPPDGQLLVIKRKIQHGDNSNFLI